MERETSSEQVRHAWNSGLLVGPKPPLKPKDIWAIRAQLRHQHRIRDLALFNLAIDSKLRGCDLVHLRVADVVLAGSVRPRASVVQSKTGRPVVFELTEASRESVQGWLRVRPQRNCGDVPGRGVASDHHGPTAEQGRACCQAGTAGRLTRALSLTGAMVSSVM